MAGSLFLLLDDIASALDDVASMTKVAATKTAGVIGDDLALNAKQISGIAADRELAVVAAVARGSARNKLILVPAALALGGLAPWAVRPLLMIGGGYLCYEGVEKLTHGILHMRDDSEDRRHAGDHVSAPRGTAADHEAAQIRGAVRTDFILSAEIIVITLGVVAGQSLPVQVAVLTAVAVAMTVFVYGLVAAIVKLDDVGLRLTASSVGWLRGLGTRLVRLSPWLLRGLSVAGTAAMFLVGGGIVAHAVPAVHDVMHGLIGRLAAAPWRRWLEWIAEGGVGCAVGAIVFAIVSAVRAAHGGPGTPTA